MVITSRRIGLLLVLGAVMLGIASAALAQVTARVDRNRLIEGETLTLVLQTNETRQSLEADLSALESDFIILDQRSETQMSIVNGKQSAVIRKMVTLEPLRSGRLTIPALSMGGATTQPIVVDVDAAPEAAPGEPEPVFIEVALNPAEGPYYVHAQIGLTVRLFYQQSLTEAAISQPEPENASVRLLDEVPFQAERGGQHYRVLERRYALFPERSGDMVVPPLVLSGRLTQRSDNRLWQPSSRGRRITVQSEPITVDVSPRPASFSGDSWQPARSYRLGEQVSTSGEIKVGEPVTRTITIDAVGLEENMIAEPASEEIPNARIYPDQPQGISRDDGEWVLGHKEYRYAVVPEKEGELVLPEVKVAWWDTVADQQRMSVLPARTVRVLPSGLGVASDTAVAATSPVAASQNGSLDSGESAQGTYWRWLAIGFAALWTITLVFAARARSKAKPAVDSQREIDEAAVVGALKQACASGDAPAARKALRTWLRRFASLSSRSRSSLVDFAHECGSAPLGRQVRALDAEGFSPDGHSWDGKEMFRAWQEWRKAEVRSGAGPEPPITDLYAQAR
jgi:hypothetical protein